MAHLVFSLEEIQDLSVWAFTEGGKLVHASTAERGKIYYSKCCGCRVHIVHRGGKAFYARNPNTPHEIGCKKIKQKIIKDLGATSSDELFGRWLKPRCHTSSSKEPPNQPSVASTHGRVQRVSSQKDFYELGLYEKACKNDKVGNHTVGDYILTYDNIPAVMNGNESIGKLSIPVKKDGYSDDLLALQFILLDGGPITRSKAFILVFPKEQRERYYAYKNRLYFSDYSEKITTVHIMADWIAANPPYCDLICRKQCKNVIDSSLIERHYREIPWRCTGMQTGLFVNDVQIHIPGLPNPPRKKSNSKYPTEES